MTTTLTHVPSGRSLSFERDPDLGNVNRRSLEQDIIVSDSGKASTNSRRVPKKTIDISFRDLTPREEARLEAFYRNVLLESQELFTLRTVPVIAEPWMAGYTQDGAALQIGDVIRCAPGDPGELLEAGEFYADMDFIELVGLRVVKASFRATATLRKGLSAVLNVEQEEPPVT